MEGVAPEDAEVVPEDVVIAEGADEADGLSIVVEGDVNVARHDEGLSIRLKTTPVKELEVGAVIVVVALLLFAPDGKDTVTGRRGCARSS